MSDERKQILEMLGQGKINVEEAERLLDALNETNPVAIEAADTNGKKPKYLHVKVVGEPGSGSRHNNVDVKVPLALLKAGMKLGALMPEKARARFNSHMAEKGIDFDFKNMDSEKIDGFVQALKDNPIEVESDNESVKIFCS